MDDKQKFTDNGVTEKRFEGEFGGSFERIHQLKVILDDLDNSYWTRAHFALYCLTYPETEPWGKALRRACNLYNKGEFGLCLEYLKGMSEDLKNGLFNTDKETASV